MDQNNATVCPACGQHIERLNLTFCPSCGVNMHHPHSNQATQQAERSTSTNTGCLSVLLLLVTLLVASTKALIQVTISLGKWLHAQKLTLPIRGGIRTSLLAIFLALGGGVVLVSGIVDQISAPSAPPPVQVDQIDMPFSTDVLAPTEKSPRATLGAGDTSEPTPTNTLTPEPTHTPEPTDTPDPTETPTSPPTETPLPTDTPIPSPTDTPAPPPTDTPIPPTNTPAVTATPIPPSPVPTDPPAPTATPQPSRDYLADGVWNCPVSTAGAAYVGSRNSDKYHKLNCRWAKEIYPQNRICFANSGAATAFGYQPCKVCKP